MQALSAQRDQLGECPRWHAETQTLWWVDITKHQIHHHHPESGKHGIIQLNEEIGCFIWREKGGLLVALQSGFHFIEDLNNPVLTPIVIRRQISLGNVLTMDDAIPRAVLLPAL